MANLGDLLKRAGLSASPAAEAPAPAEPPPQAPEAITYAPKVVVRFSRKGRGGRTVTLVQGVLTGRERLAKQLRRELGTGVKAEAEQLVIQGKQVERVAAWLREHGAKKVIS